MSMQTMETAPSPQTQTPQEMPEMGTKPVPEHQWLGQLVGEWRLKTEMTMEPGQPPLTSEGTETVKSLGGLWAFAEGNMPGPGGEPMTYYSTLGYDVSFKEYRGGWFASMSSHLWKQTGELSADGKTMTLNCVGPDMVVDGKEANYRDVIEIQDKDHRTQTSYAQDDRGKWQAFMKSHYTRI